MRFGVGRRSKKSASRRPTSHYIRRRDEVVISYLRTRRFVSLSFRAMWNVNTTRVDLSAAVVFSIVDGAVKRNDRSATTARWRMISRVRAAREAACGSGRSGGGVAGWFGDASNKRGHFLNMD